jgi:methionine-gamma-lyase
MTRPAGSPWRAPTPRARRSSGCGRKAVELITPAVRLGGTDTLIEHPAALTHLLVDEDARTAYGVGPGTPRISVGCEDPIDLWAHLESALAHVREHATR